MGDITLVREENEFFVDWIKKEFMSHNDIDNFYKIDLEAKIEFDRNEFYYKLMKNDQMIGFVGLKKKDDELFNSHFLYIHRLYIDTPYRNQGIGTKVMQQLVQIAKDMNRDMELECLDGNPAIHLYEKMGFKVRYHNMVLKINK